MLYSRSPNIQDDSNDEEYYVNKKGLIGKYWYPRENKVVFFQKGVKMPLMNMQLFCNSAAKLCNFFTSKFVTHLQLFPPYGNLATFLPYQNSATKCSAHFITNYTNITQRYCCFNHHIRLLH